MNLTYQKLNNYLGIFVFILSSICYLLTVEPNISFWDTGEYIASASKLEVTHSPGAAFFQLLGAVFAGLGFGNGDLYPRLINSMNAILSGLCIMFTFWSISFFMWKIVSAKPEFKLEAINSKIIILGAALVGALSFAFSDTFWYSAVEGEVYAMASCFIALLIWLITKWERDEDTAHTNRWLILISLIIGLSVGVHMMVLLAVPALCYIYYQKNYEITLKSFLIANGITLLVLGFVFKFIFPFIMNYFGKTEIFMVNELGLPFNSGLFFALVLLAVVFYFALHYSKKLNYPKVNSVIWSVLFLLIGFSCWMMIPIRANANPPMNLNNPDNAIGMKDYYNREQYGDWPTFYGAYYTAYLDKNGLVKTEDTGPIYLKNENSGRYEISGHHFKYVFDKKHVGLFPRMYYPSNENRVLDNYATYWGYPAFELDDEYKSNPQAQEFIQKLNDDRLKGNLTIEDYQKYRDYITIKPPTLMQNINYFFQFQIGQMYMRYLLWNFVGKQNDQEWDYSDFKGNWQDGILLNNKNLPAQYTDKGTNHYYFLPFILGLIGLFFQLNRDFGRFYALLSLFLLAGIGIILYTNVKIFEPRERDYALVGSFYVFAMWVGLGAGAILEYLTQKFKNQNISIAGLVLLLGIPLLMAFQNWDDHDRSHRYTAYDEAYSYLKPLEKKSILFVYGDNDTYPLWGVQENSGLRTDVKIINYTLLGTSWYIEQTQRKTYDAEKLPSSLTFDEYKESINDQVIMFDSKIWQTLFNEYEELWNQSKDYGYSREEFAPYVQYIQKDSMTAQEAIAFIKDKSDTKKRFIKFINFFLYNNNQETYEDTNLLPVSKIVIPVNKANCLKYGIVNPEDADKMLDNIVINIKQSSLHKAELAMLDLFANYNWDRPIYFSSGGIMDPGSTFYLNEYVEFSGFSYKLVPIKTPRNDEGDYGRVNANNIYRIISQFKWGNFKDPKAHFDAAGLNNIMNYRQSAGRAAIALIDAGQNKKAKEVLDKCMEEIPLDRYPGSTSLDDIIYSYIRIGEEKKGLEITQQYQKSLMDTYAYYEKLSPKEQRKHSYEIARLISYYAFAGESVSKAYLDLGKKEKAIDYINSSLDVWNKKLDELMPKIKSPEDFDAYDLNIQNVLRAFTTLTASMEKTDSLFVLEKQLQLQMKLEKMQQQAGIK